MTDDDWDTVMNVHLRGAFLMTRAAQQVFVAQKYGKIVNLSSVSALGNRGQANYAAAKMGIQGFTRTLGIELGPYGVNVNAIAPGFIATDMTDATAARVGMSVEDFRQAAADRNPVRRVGLPRGHRGRSRVPVQRRGVVRHRPGAVRRRRRHAGLAGRLDAPRPRPCAVPPPKDNHNGADSRDLPPDRSYSLCAPPLLVESRAPLPSSSPRP